MSLGGRKYLDKDKFSYKIMHLHFIGAVEKDRKFSLGDSHIIRQEIYLRINFNAGKHTLAGQCG